MKHVKATTKTRPALADQAGIEDLIKEIICTVLPEQDKCPDPS